MSTTTVPRPFTQPQIGDRATASETARVRTGLPWYIWCALAAVTSAQIGAHWDISWHESIGRDSFWTPAHMAIYACGILTGIAYGYVIFRTTFSKNPTARNSSVRILGLSGPLGAFIASWGGIAMLTSAPFDNWWHDAYGLDVTIVSPPHLVLFAGVYAVMIGTSIMIAGHMNRTSGTQRETARWAFLYSVAMLLIGIMVLLMEFVFRPHLHSSLAYILLSVLVPIALAAVSSVTRFRFAATITTGIYTLFIIGCILILPLFPAEPKLGPVYQHVTQFIPPQFPILLIVPALLLDLFWSQSRIRSVWWTSLCSAVIFVVSLVAVEWPFASFLISPASANRFFGTGYLNYGVPPWSSIAQHRFYLPETAGQMLLGMLIAIAVATLTFRFGRMRGKWMASVQR